MAAWLQDHAALSASLAGLQLGVVAAFDSSLAWALDGARSPVAWLVGNTGESRVSLGGSLKTARLARTMHHVTAAALAGQLCAEKVRLLTRARTDEVAELFDGEEEILVREAAGLTVDHLRVHLSGWRLRALESLGRNEPDGPRPIPETEADRINLFEGFAGRGLIDGDLNPDSREILFRAVGAQIDAWHRDGELVDDARSPSELNAAAVLELVRRGSSDTTEHGHPRPLVIALASWDSLTEAERQAILRRAGAGSSEADATDLAEPTDLADTAADGPDALGDAVAPAEAAGAGSGTVEPGVSPATERAPPSEQAAPSGSLARRSRCEIVGAGPVPVRALARLLAQPGAEVCRVVLGPDGLPVEVSRAIRTRLGGSDPPGTGGLLARLRAASSAPLDLDRRRRHASWAQWIGLLVRSGGVCEVPGCTVAYWRTHAHHLQEWEHDGPTDLGNLSLACRFDHHHTIHRRGFTLTPDPNLSGKFELRRPDGSVVWVPYQ